MIQAFRYELDPNDVTRSALASHTGAARFVFNWGLALVKSRLAERERTREAARCEGYSEREAAAWAAAEVDVPWSLPALRREWNAAKAQMAPWWAENSKEAYSSGLDALARALKAFSDSKRGRRKGHGAGFPKFRRRSARRSCRFTTGSLGVIDSRHIRLPRIGAIRTKEATTTLSEAIHCGTARILSATVSEAAGRWYVSFGCEVARQRGAVVMPDAVVGVDVGVRFLAVISTGEVVPNPKPLNRYARRTARLARQLARQQRGGRGRPASGRSRRTRTRLARCHARVAHLRSDGLHKLTTALATTYGTVVVEDLNVTGMSARARGRGRRPKAGLNRAVLDASFGEARRQLAYKCQWYGSRLVVAGRWYPSSKTCSACGAAKAKLPLSQRSFTCEACGLVLDRDHNAALNLAALAADVAASGAETQNGRGGERLQAGSISRCSPAKRQAGSPPGQRSGTAALQETAV